MSASEALGGQFAEHHQALASRHAAERKEMNALHSARILKAIS